MDCAITGPVVSDLIDQHPGRFAVVTPHVNSDAFAVPWGQERLDVFYSLGSATPTLMFDGWLNCGSTDYAACLDQNLGVPTDVTLHLSGTQVSGQTWDVEATVCIETGGSNRNLRIYTAATLNDYPNPPTYSRNVLMQDVATEDVTVSSGNCRNVTTRITFDDQSWSSRSDITIIAWAQEPNASGPATVHQAAIMAWPFPQAPELTTIVISPSTAELEVYETLIYTATGKDQNDDGFVLTDPLWYTTGDGAGTFDPERGSTTPEFTAERPGTTNVVCTQGGITGQATVVITGDPPELSSIAILPASAEIEVGQSRPFTAIGADQYGGTFPLNNPSWAITGDGSGTFDPPGGSATPLFTATRPGTAQITCTDGSVSGAAALTISGDPPQLAEITISPDSATLNLGETRTFTANGTDQYGDPLTPDNTVWSVSGDGNGTFDPPGDSATTAFTATAVGSAEVTAWQEGIEGSASIEITDQELPKPRRVKARHSQ